MLAELERLSAISWQPLLDISKEYKEAYPGDGGWVRLLRVRVKVTVRVRVRVEVRARAKVRVMVRVKVRVRVEVRVRVNIVAAAAGHIERVQGGLPGGWWVG